MVLHQPKFQTANLKNKDRSILGPLLFTLYINNLPSVGPNVFTQMYAESNDTVIYVNGSSISQVAEKLKEQSIFKLQHS